MLGSKIGFSVVNILSKIANLFLIIYLARNFSETDYGYFSLYTLGISYLGMINFGANSVFNMTLPKVIHDTKKTGELLVNYIFLALLLVFITSPIIYFIFALSAEMLLYGACIGIAIGRKLLETLQTYFDSKFNFKTSLIIRSVWLLCLPIISMIAVSYNTNFEILFYSQFCFLILIFLILYKSTSKHIEYDAGKLKISVIVNIVKTGMPIFAMFLLGLMMRDIDRILIARYFSIEDLAIYSFTFSLSAVIMGVCTSWVQPIGQKIYTAVGIGDAQIIRSLVNRAVLETLFLSVIGSVLISLSYPYLTGVIIGKYENGHELLTYFLIIFMVYSLVHPIFFFTNAIEASIKFLKMHVVLTFGIIVIDAIIIYYGGSLKQMILSTCVIAFCYLIWVFKLFRSILGEYTIRKVVL